MTNSFKVLYTATTTCDNTWEWRNRQGKQSQGDLFNLWLIISGAGHWETNKESFELKPGDLFVQRLWEPCYGNNPYQDDLVIAWANFVVVDQKGATVPKEKAVEYVPKLFRPLKDRAFIKKLFDRSDFYFEDKNFKKANSWFDLLIDEVFTQDKNKRPSQISENQFSEINLIIHEIKECPWDIKMLKNYANRLHCSENHFTRLLKIVQGQSLRELIKLSKINKAKELLLMTNLQMKQIADQLGYSDIFHFSKQFKEVVKVSPSEFRKQIRK